MGSLRFALAVIVAVGHLADTGQIGFLAVFGFYLLSGYLITRALNDVYHFRALPFAANRALRLMPMYYAVLLLTLGAILVWPNEAASFKPEWDLNAAGHREFWSNALIVPYLTGGMQFRLVPPSWSLAVELAQYALLWLVIARRQSFALIALLIAIAYHFRSLGVGEPFGPRYTPLLAALLPFSVGALLYFGLRERRISLPTWPILAAWASVVAIAVFVKPHGHLWDAIFYLNLILIALCVVALAPHDFGRLDRSLGELSYPVFLVHWLVGLGLSGWLGNRSLGLAVVSLPIIFCVSSLLVRGSNALIEPLRDSIRLRALRNGTTAPPPAAPAPLAATAGQPR